MSFAINLRRDLIKLSDGELKLELERLERYRKDRFESEPRVGSAKGILYYGVEWPFGRAQFALGGHIRYGLDIFGPSEDGVGPFIWLSARLKI